MWYGSAPGQRHFVCALCTFSRSPRPQLKMKRGSRLGFREPTIKQQQAPRRPEQGQLGTHADTKGAERRFSGVGPAGLFGHAVRVTMALDSFGFPVEAERPVKARRVGVDAPVQTDDIAMLRELIGAAHPNQRAEKATFKWFERWCSGQAGSLPTGWGERLACFATKVARTYENPGTALTYGRAIEKLIRRQFPMEKLSLQSWHDVEKGLALQYAAFERQHALDISKELAQEVLARTKAVDVRVTLCLLMACGARCADQERLESWQVQLATNGVLHISFRVTKSRRDAHDKFVLAIKPWFDLPVTASSGCRTNTT
jgi:hypothetical protein